MAINDERRDRAVGIIQERVRQIVSEFTVNPNAAESEGLANLIKCSQWLAMLDEGIDVDYILLEVLAM
jgi:hypothetical protein